MAGDSKTGIHRWLRGVVFVLATLWALNSAVFCFAATRAEAAMACCPPSDCGDMVSPAPQNCCTMQSSPSRPAVSPVLLSDHVAEDAVAVVAVSSAVLPHHATVLTSHVRPHAPPGCNFILRI